MRARRPRQDYLADVPRPCVINSRVCVGSADSLTIVVPIETFSRRERRHRRRDGGCALGRSELLHRGQLPSRVSRHAPRPWRRLHRAVPRARRGITSLPATPAVRPVAVPMIVSPLVARLMERVAATRETRAAPHRGARAGSRPARGHSTGIGRRPACTTGTARPDRPLPRPRAPLPAGRRARLRDGGREGAQAPRSRRRLALPARRRRLRRGPWAWPWRRLTPPARRPSSFWKPLKLQRNGCASCRASDDERQEGDLQCVVRRERRVREHESRVGSVWGRGSARDRRARCLPFWLRLRASRAEAVLLRRTLFTCSETLRRRADGA